MGVRLELVNGQLEKDVSKNQLAEMENEQSRARIAWGGVYAREESPRD